MGWFTNDLRLAFRRLRQSPGFAAVAILTLALGIGANTTIFSAVNGILFRPLPVERPNELVFLNNHGKIETPTQSYPNYRDYRDRNDVLSGLAGYRVMPLSVSRNGSSARAWGYLVTGNYFDVLGVQALRGRVLHPDDDEKPAGHPIAVLTYGCWQRRFAADPDLVGKTVKINGLDYTVAGITPAGFIGTELFFAPDIFLPMMMEPQMESGKSWLEDRRAQNMFVLGRLKPGVSAARAESALNAVAAELGREYPSINEGVGIALSPPGLVGSFLRGPVKGFATVLMAVAGLVLLIACVNLASLLLARSSDRRKETAIRLALGAKRGQLVRQLLTESMVLSLAGGAAGLLMALWLTDLFSAWRPPVDFPISIAMTIDARVLAFAAAASLFTILAFGLVPALEATRGGLALALKNDAPGGRFRNWHVRDGLVATQIALSVVLLTGSVLVVRSLRHALSLQLGFNPEHAASVSFDLGLEGYSDKRGAELQRRLLEKVSALPGVRSAALASSLPLSLYWSNNEVYLEGKPAVRAADLPMAGSYRITPGYLRTMETKLVTGRDFDARDTNDAKRVAIVNQAFAGQLLPGEDPLGKRFRFSSPTEELTEIVGVIEDGKYHSLGETPTPVVFRPLGQGYDANTTLVARSSLPDEETLRSLRRAVAELDPAISIYGAGSLREQLSFPLFPARLAASVLSAFGVLAIVLAATGLYGVMAYAVSRRTREIGIRMALGAATRQVLRLVFRRAVMLLVLGGAVGSAAALAGGQFFAQILYGVSPRDPLTFGLALFLMASVTLVACWLPARRAMAVDPATALRQE